MNSKEICYRKISTKKPYVSNKMEKTAASKPSQKILLGTALKMGKERISRICFKTKGGIHKFYFEFVHILFKLSFFSLKSRKILLKELFHTPNTIKL